MKAVRPAPHPAVLKVEKDPNAIRTIIVSGLPSSVDSKTLWKKVRKLEGAEKIDVFDEKECTGKFVVL